MTDREPGCRDNSCIFSCLRTRNGMRTNGGCRCFKNLIMNCNIIGTDGENVPYDNREQVEHLRRSVMMLLWEYRKVKKDIIND